MAEAAPASVALAQEAEPESQRRARAGASQQKSLAFPVKVAPAANHI